MEPTKPSEIPVEISPDQLSEEALLGVIESFIMREGTDYGAVEISHQTKIDQIRKQLLKGDVKIFFDQVTETINLVRHHR